jgi:hypothetical protein
MMNRRQESIGRMKRLHAHEFHVEEIRWHNLQTQRKLIDETVKEKIETFGCETFVI